MYTIPLSQYPSQRFTVILGNQNCTIELLWRNDELYSNLYTYENTVWQGKVCRDRVPMKQGPYAPFVGDLAFIDTLGANDPNWEELGDRYILVYLEDGETVDSYNG